MIHSCCSYIHGSYDEMNHCSFIEIVFVLKKKKIRAGFSSAILFVYTYATPAAALVVGRLFCFLFLFFCGHVKVDKTAYNINIIVRRHNNNCPVRHLRLPRQSRVYNYQVMGVYIRRLRHHTSIKIAPNL